MKISEIKTASPFKDLFRIDPELLRKIEENIGKNGYDPGKPVIIWKETGIILVGHIRLQAARNKGLVEISAIEASFAKEEDAFIFAVKDQVERRNLAEWDILNLVEKIDEVLPRGGDRRSEEAKSKFSNEKIESPRRRRRSLRKGLILSEGKETDSRDRTADLLNISLAKVSYCRAILKDGDRKLIREIEEGKRTLYSAYLYILEKGRRPQTQSEANDKRENILKKLDSGKFYRKSEELGGFFFRESRQANRKHRERLEHLDRLCFELIPRLMAKENVLEEMKRQLSFFQGEGEYIFKGLMDQDYIKEFLGSPFIQVFVSLLENFGFRVEWPKGIEKIPRKMKEKKPRVHSGFDISKVHEAGFVSKRERKEVERGMEEVAERDLVAGNA